MGKRAKNPWPFYTVLGVGFLVGFAWAAYKGLSAGYAPGDEANRYILFEALGGGLGGAFLASVVSVIRNRFFIGRP